MPISIDRWVSDAAFEGARSMFNDMQTALYSTENYQRNLAGNLGTLIDQQPGAMFQEKAPVLKKTIPAPPWAGGLRVREAP